MKSRLLEILSLFNAGERQQLELFLQNPLFNKNERLIQLFRLLCPYLEGAERSGLNRSWLAKQLFAGEKADERKVNNELSGLLQLVYQFLAIQELNRQDLLQTDLVIEFLLGKDQAELARHVLRKRHSLQEKQPLRNSDYYLDVLRTADQQDRQELFREKRGYNTYLQQKSDALDLFYHCEKLRVAVNMASRNMVVNADYAAAHLEHIFVHYQQQPQLLQQHPAIHVYFLCLKMLRNPEKESYYYQLKELMQQHLTVFPQPEQRTLYSYLLNYCVRQINSGRSTFYEEILQLYKVLLQEKIIFKNGYLTQWTYINIVTAGIRLRNYDWTEQFIRNYRDYLLPEVRENVFNYNLATLFFEKGDLDNALQMLQSISFTDAFYHMAAKIIQLKIYYLQQEEDAFQSLLLASRRYLSRNNQLSGYQKKSNQHFIQLIGRLSRLRDQKLRLSRVRFKAQLEKYRSALLKTGPVANKHWLEEQLKSLSLSL